MMIFTAVFSAILVVTAVQGAIPEHIGFPCLFVKCGPGRKCVYKRNFYWIGDRCYPQHICVPDKTYVKPGRCPSVRRQSSRSFCKSDCEVDADCKGADKCCSKWCGGRTCQAPADLITPTRSCATTKCQAGYECVMKPDPCSRPPCETNPVCVPIKKEKEGVCPRLRFGSIRMMRKLSCQRECQSDGDCVGIKKCCKTSWCGTSCQDPEPISCDSVGCEPGYHCVRKHELCRSPPCRPTSTCVWGGDLKIRCPDCVFHD